MDNAQFKIVFGQFSKEVHQNARDKGWWDERENLMSAAMKHGQHDFAKKMIISNLICLSHSELSEGLEGLRKDLKDDKCPEFDMLTVELADTIIRIMDLAEGFKLPLAEAMVAKAAMNRGRAIKHGGKAF